MTITEFLTARLAEDEATAREADATVLPGDLPRETHIAYGLKDAGFGIAYQGFVLVHDPARVLREVEAGRNILAEHAARPPRPSDGQWHGLAPDRLRCRVCASAHEGHWLRFIAPCWTLMQLAMIYSDHPDYDPAWTPEPA